MRAKSKYSDCKNIENIERYGYFKESEINISKEKEYEIHAIVVFEGIIMLQVINDINYPDWLPSIFFEILDTSIPIDWECNVLYNEPKMLIGPCFISKSQSSYESMVQLEPTEVNLFWERVKLLEDSNHTE